MERDKKVVKHIRNNKRPVRPGKPASVFYGAVIIFIAIFIGLGYSMSTACEGYNLVFSDDKDFFAPQGPMCTYNEIDAACGQLLIKFRSFKNPVAVKHVLRILDDNKALRIGQMPSDGMIQISVQDNLVLKLREELKKTGVVIVTFVVEATFNEGKKGTSRKPKE